PLAPCPQAPVPRGERAEFRIWLGARPGSRSHLGGVYRGGRSSTAALGLEPLDRLRDRREGSGDANRPSTTFAGPRFESRPFGEINVSRRACATSGLLIIGCLFLFSPALQAH